MVNLRGWLSSDSTGSEEASYMNDDYSIPVRVLIAIRGSLLLFTIALGVVMALLGVVLEYTAQDQGVLAAMLLIWGVSAVIGGALGFASMILLGLR